MNKFAFTWCIIAMLSSLCWGFMAYVTYVETPTAIPYSKIIFTIGCVAWTVWEFCKIRKKT